jgi:citrate/tricarballylate utilization protein
MLSAELLSESQRQLSVCNSCRYCAAYCPVWPALEQHTELSAASVVDLANLCHDCRDCYEACMYTAPHEFDLNPPALFAAVRQQTYEEFAWPGSRPAWLRGPLLFAAAFVAASSLLAALGALTTHAVLPSGLRGSAYGLITHWVLVGVVMLPSAWAILAFAMSSLKYWEAVGGTSRGLLDAAAWRATIWQALTLRHQSGGGSGCSYPSEKPSHARRRWHHLVSYGFGLTFIATISAAIAENVLGQEPPYSYASVPVITGLAGGVAMVLGCVGLLDAKRRSAPELTTPTMRAADQAMLWCLLVLAATGILVLALRDSPLFSTVLIVHLGAVLTAIALAPYTKFMHWIYRLLAMYRDNRDVNASREVG